MEVNGTNSVGYAGQGGSVTPVSVPQPSKTPDREVTTSDSAVSAAAVASQTSPTANTSSEGKGKDAKVTDEQIKQAVQEINKKGTNGTEAVFGIHEKTNRVTIKIVDKKTKDVIKEVPAEKTLDLIAKAWEMAGLLVDEKR